MLAADKLLLRSTVKQRTIELREKELNLFNSNFSSVATQAALFAGFSMSFLEMSVHFADPTSSGFAKGCLHLCATICVASNVFVVSIITFVSVWGSGKALRGRDGSMAMVIDGMNTERGLIFRTIGIGLVSLLGAVASSTWLLMDMKVASVASILLAYACHALITHALRIYRKFKLDDSEIVQFSDFLRSLPKPEENEEERDDYDEETPLSGKLR